MKEEKDDGDEHDGAVCAMANDMCKKTFLHSELLGALSMEAESVEARYEGVATLEELKSFVSMEVWKDELKQYLCLKSLPIFMVDSLFDVQMYY